MHVLSGSTQQTCPGRCNAGHMVKGAFVLTVGVCGAIAATSTGCGSLDRSLRGYEATARPAGVAAKLNELSADINRGYEATGAPRSAISTQPVENAGCGGMWRSVTGDPYTGSSPYSLDVQLQAWISPRSRLRPVLAQLRQHLEQVGWTVTDDEAAPPPPSSCLVPPAPTPAETARLSRLGGGQRGTRPVSPHHHHHGPLPSAPRREVAERRSLRLRA